MVENNTQSAAANELEQAPLQARIAELERLVLDQAQELAQQRSMQGEALRRSEQRYEELVSISPFGILLHENDRISFINRRGMEILGASDPAQVLGRSPLDFVHADAVNLFWQRNTRLQTEGRVPLGEYKLQGLDGRSVQIEVASVCVQLGQQQIVQTVFQDVSERQLAQEREREHERSLQLSQHFEGLGLFAGGIAQRLNGLLIGILGNASLAQEECTANRQLSSIIGEIEHASQQARSLTGQLLALAGSSLHLLDEVDINALVSAEVQRAAGHFTANLRLELDLAEQLPPLPADPVQLQHALLQLLDNSSEALGEAGGLISVRTGCCIRKSTDTGTGKGGDSVPDHYCFVEVADNGGGIPPALLEQLFDPFRAGRDAHRGLGLPTVQGILRAHRGAVEVESVPGQGTTVRLLLPQRGSSSSRPARLRLLGA